MDAIYRVDHNRIVTSPHAAGPWDPTMQHGGGPAALVVWAAEAVPAAQPMQVARLTIDLLRPVPVAPLTYETEVLREGRKIQLVGVRLLANGVVVVRASVLKIRKQTQPLPPGVGTAAIDVPMPEQGSEMPTRPGNAFITGLTLSAVRGGFLVMGPGAVWYRMNRTVVEGAPVSQAMRAVIAADFSNGTSSVLDFGQWTFLNADLTVSLAREPVGDWILLNAESWIGPDGAGIAAARLGDRDGYFGRAIQNLVVEAR